MLVIYLDASYCDLVISVINLVTYLYKEASYEVSRTTAGKHKQEIVKIDDEDCDSVPLQVLRTRYDMKLIWRIMLNGQ